MLYSITLILVVLLVAVLGFAATRPDTFRIERSTNIKALPEKLFPYINDFHQWEAWSPWEKIDPAIQRSYSGAATGKGAVYEWQGNRDIGKGRMEIIESTPSSNLIIKLHFIQPFEARNTVEFKLEPQGNTARVSQAMYGSSPFIAKLMGLFFSMEKMVGQKYEEGLANLKAIAEKE
ncbi:MAG: SRPBCC family protein [Methylobacter sp.]|nr:SRPBCC family protein [Methylobacter sp.]